MSTVIEPPVTQAEKHLEELETVTIRFAGDSGDGMQLTGTQFTNTSAVVGNEAGTQEEASERTKSEGPLSVFRIRNSAVFASRMARLHCLMSSLGSFGSDFGNKFW